MASTIKLKNGSGAPTTGDLVQGEPALDLTNKRLYTENASGVVIEVGTNPSTIDINAGTIDGTVIGGSTAAAITGTTITGTSFVSSGDMTFGDDDKAIFGAGSDLQIYHDGHDSYVSDTGGGSLYLRGSNQVRIESATGEKYFIANADADTNLYYDNAAKLATTATGIDVTGTVTADGLTVDKSGGNIAASFINSDSNNSYIQFQNSTTGTTTYTDGSLVGIDSDESLTIWQLESNHIKFGTSATERMRIDSAGTLFQGTTSPTLHSSMTGTVFTNGSLLTEAARGADKSLTLAQNVAIDAGNTWAYLSTDEASYYQQYGGNHYFATAASGTAGADATLATKMIILNDGNVGIGTSSPTGAKLQVVAESGSNVLGVGTTTQGLFIKTTGTTVDYNSSGNSAGEHTFSTGNIERMRIDVSGNVGIGTSSPNSYAGQTTLTINSTGVARLDLDINDAYQGYLLAEAGYIGLYAQSGNYISMGVAGVGEAIRIDSSGNLGLGVVPSAWRSGAKAFQSGGNGLVTLWEQANGSTNLGFGVYESASNVFNYTTTGDTPTLYSQLTGVHKWFNAPSGTAGNAISFTQAMTLDASGNLLVGATSNAVYGGHVLQKDGTDSNALAIINSATSNPYGPTFYFSGASPNDATRYFLNCADSTAARAVIRSNGGFANYQANDVNLSDERVKTDIAPLGSMWDKFKALEIVTFKYKDQTHDDNNIGVIAQQVEAVAPEFVDNEGFGETPEGEEPLKAIYTADLYHAAIKALQEAMDRIETLETEVAALKGAN
jgi:uncharacterized protein YaiE (UPF0345 family)